MLQRWFRACVRRLPARCEVCRAWPARPVCAECESLFGAPCARMAPGIAALDACIAALPYAYPWNNLIQRLKFHAEPGLAGVLAPLMLRAPGALSLLADTDRVVPMPLGPRRLAQRGYNQAHELARRLVPGRVDTRCLLRTRDTRPQSQLRRIERQHNVEGAFAVEPGQARSLRGQQVILVDDVMTTGASLQAAAAALRQGGARTVSALVLARTDD